MGPIEFGRRESVFGQPPVFGKSLRNTLTDLEKFLCFTSTLIAQLQTTEDK